MSSALTYWEKKILNWEKARYSKWLFFYPLSWTVRNRLYTAVKILKERAKKDWSVLELGCGSGILASYVSDSFDKLTGVDLAPSAVAVAKKRIQSERVQFIAGNVSDMSFEKVDLTIFLGLTDWLEKDQLASLFLKIPSSHLFFSYTEKEIVSPYNPYFYYRKFMDRKSNNYSCRARSYSRLEIQSMLQAAGYEMEIVKSASVVNPGVLIWAKK